MANKRHKTEEIVTKLRQVGAVVGQGMARIDGIREVRITNRSFIVIVSNTVAWGLLSSRNRSVFRRRMNGSDAPYQV